jgi:hypothetical protein
VKNFSCDSSRSRGNAPVARLSFVPYLSGKVNPLFFFVCAAPIASAFGQGQIRFETYLPSVVDANVTLPDVRGPGPEFSAQLYLADASGFVTNALAPATTFRAAGSGIDAIADRYVEPIDVTVPNFAPGSSVNLIMRVWRTSSGSYDNSGGCDKGQSAPFTITLGGGNLPPAPLTTLRAFTLGNLGCYVHPFISAISIKNGQVLITADDVTDQTQVLGTTNLQTWINLNLIGTPTSFRHRTFTISPGLSYENYRLEEP